MIIRHRWTRIEDSSVRELIGGKQLEFWPGRDNESLAVAGHVVDPIANQDGRRVDLSGSIEAFLIHDFAGRQIGAVSDSLLVLHPVEVVAANDGRRDIGSLLARPKSMGIGHVATASQSHRQRGDTRSATETIDDALVRHDAGDHVPADIGVAFPESLAGRRVQSPDAPLDREDKFATP